MKYLFIFTVVIGSAIQVHSGLIFDDLAPDVPQTEIWAVHSKTRDIMNGIFLGPFMKYFKDYKTEYKLCYEKFDERYKLVAHVFGLNMDQCGQNINRQLPVKYLTKVNQLRAELKAMADSAKEFAEKLGKMIHKHKFDEVQKLKDKLSDWAFYKYNNFYGIMLFIRKNTQKKAEELIDYVNFHRNQTADFAWNEGKIFEKCIQDLNNKENAIKES